MNFDRIVIPIRDPADKRFIFIALMRILGLSNNFAKEVVNNAEYVVFKVK